MPRVFLSVHATQQKRVQTAKCRGLNLNLRSTGMDAPSAILSSRCNLQLGTKKSGFSIVQVLVAAALMSLLALAMGQLMTNMARGQKSAFSAAQNSDEANLLRLALGDPTRCKNAFKDASGQNIKINRNQPNTEFPVAKIQIDNGTGTGISDLLASENTSKRTLAISLKQKGQLSPAPPPGASALYLYNVKLAFNTPNTYPPSRTIEIPFSVSLDAGLAPIKNCSFVDLTQNFIGCPFDNLQDPVTGQFSLGQAHGYNDDGGGNDWYICCKNNKIVYWGPGGRGDNNPPQPCDEFGNKGPSVYQNF